MLARCHYPETDPRPERCTVSQPRVPSDREWRVPNKWDHIADLGAIVAESTRLNLEDRVAFGKEGLE
jgi:hypothetical protein